VCQRYAARDELNSIGAILRAMDLGIHAIAGKNAYQPVNDLEFLSME
jgi:hypothetical protein